MSTITIKRELPAEFLSDILVTAFDGAYGASWDWFKPAKRNWLTVKHDETCNWKPKDPDDSSGCNVTGCHCDDTLWMSASVRLKSDCETGITSIDNISTEEGFLVDHETLAAGIQRIVNDDYIGTWREATPTEKVRLLGPDRHLYADREWKWDGLTLLVETGETARGYREELAKIISGLETGATDAGDIDAPFADAIVQVGVFGKAIFS